MLGERIKEARVAADLTQEELAQRCNTTKQTIYKYEKGVINNIPFDKLEIIAKALRVSSAQLMGWEDSPPRKPAKRYRIKKRTISPNRRALLELAETATDEEVNMLLRLAKAVLAEHEK